MTMWLYRAVAYRMVALRESVGDSVWPEATVFIETHQPDAATASAHLIRTLAAAWSCPTSEIDFYNLWSEGELLRASHLPASAGDARLLENGWSYGPLFCDIERTVMLVRPHTLRRLVRAQGRAADLQMTAALSSPHRLPVAGRRAGDRNASAPTHLSAVGGASA